MLFFGVGCVCSLSALSLVGSGPGWGEWALLRPSWLPHDPLPRILLGKGTWPLGGGQTPQAFAGYFPQFSMEFLIQETGSLKNQSKEVLQGDGGARDPSSSTGDLQAERKIKLEKVVEFFSPPGV